MFRVRIKDIIVLQLGVDIQSEIYINSSLVLILRTYFVRSNGKDEMK